MKLEKEIDFTEQETECLSHCTGICLNRLLALFRRCDLGKLGDRFQCIIRSSCVLCECFLGFADAESEKGKRGKQKEERQNRNRPASFFRLFNSGLFSYRLHD